MTQPDREHEPERLRIERAGPPDAGPVRRLVRDAYARWVPVIGREPLPVQVDYHQAIRAHDIDLLRAGEALVGLIETILRVDHVFIENIAVDPAHQGRGHGRRLLRHADQLARQAGLGELRLQTNQAFAANIDFYRRGGFRIDRTAPFRGGTVVFMSRTIG